MLLNSCELSLLSPLYLCSIFPDSVQAKMNGHKCLCTKDTHTQIHTHPGTHTHIQQAHVSVCVCVCVFAHLGIIPFIPVMCQRLWGYCPSEMCKFRTKGEHTHSDNAASGPHSLSMLTNRRAQAFQKS